MKKTSDIRNSIQSGILTIGIALVTGLVGCSGEDDSASAKPQDEAADEVQFTAENLTPLPIEVETVHSSKHVLVREVLLPTPAAVGRAFYLGNPIFRPVPPDETRLATLKEITLEQLEWSEILVEGTLVNSAEETPLSEAELENALTWQPLRDYIMMWDEDEEEPLQSIASAIAGERWGSTVTEPQKPAQLYIRNAQDPALMEFWIEVEFATWAPVEAGITDSNNNGAAEVFAQLNPELFSPELALQIVSGFMGEVWGPDEVGDYLEWFLGEVYNQTYATNRTGDFDGGFPGEGLEEYVMQELGDVTVDEPDIVIVAGSEEMAKVYNVYKFRYDEAGEREEPANVEATTERDEEAASADDSAEANAPLALEYELPAPVEGELALDDFQKRTRSILDALPDGQNVHIGYDEWLFLPESLWLFLKADDEAEDLNSVRFLTNLSEQFASRGIQFVYVSVPTKATANPELAVGASAEEMPNQVTRAALEQLQAQGVKVVDLMEYLQTDELGKTYLKTDTHWNPLGIDRAALALVEHVRASVPTPPIEYSSQPESRKLLGDLVRQLPAELQSHFSQEQVEVEVVVDAEGNPLGADHPGSPVLVLGDSFTVIFEGGLHGRNAGLASQLARHGGAPVNQIASQGGGPGLVRDLARNMAQAAQRGEDYLANTSIVFFVMTERRLVDPAVSWDPLELPQVPEAATADESAIPNP